ncbi:hypothetical protein [Streptomyces sp. PR69]|uniref:hypothetical protein n=1 Tax=Streptomyces sp. PR69 TaxID=2984950 RepID=UPI002264C25A|nr:hypothetical protein [Streptomyces sp. PR69]
MTARDPELEKELNATLHARRELGEEYDSALVESFLEKVDQRLDSTLDRRVRRQLAEQQMSVARGARPRPPSQDSGSDSGFGERFGFTVVSLILAVPLTAIGVVNEGFKGLVVSWLGIVAVNAVHAARGWPWRRRARQDRAGDGSRGSDWEE